MNLHSWFSRSIITGIAGWLLAVSVAHAADRPNILFFLVDDLGDMDIGANNPKTFYATPNIDRLAKEGMRFTDAYAACNVCSPTRAAIMTGKYPPRVNITDWLAGRGDRPDQKLKVPKLAEGLALEEFTLAEALQAAGYQTAFIGKWHLGEDSKYFPEHQGFDVNIGGCGRGHPPSYFSPYGIPTLVDGPKGEYLNERLTEEAIKLLAAAAKRDQPFFLYFAHYAVHTPLQAKPDRVAFWKERAAQLSPGPIFEEDRGRRVREVQNHAVYAAMMESLDESIGRVLHQLQVLGLETNTIVIFTSDNGGLSTAEGTPTSNAPLRMGKGWPYEGGVRVPLIVKAPGVTRAGSVSAAQVISMDFYPTLLELAGLPLRPDQHRDGVSFAPALHGQTQSRGPIYWHYPHYSNQGGAPDGAVRDGDWKLIEWYEDFHVELYNLHEDLGERNDLAQRFPERAKELHSKLAAWREQVKAVMPTPNPDYAPRKAGAPPTRPSNVTD